MTSPGTPPGTLLDTATVLHEGRRFRIEVHPDEVSDPYDADPADVSRADLNSWGHDWRYVTVAVIPLLAGGVAAGHAEFAKAGIPYGATLAWSVTTDDLVRRAVQDGWCDIAAHRLARPVEPGHAPTCAVNNPPYLGPCDCGGVRRPLPVPHSHAA